MSDTSDTKIKRAKDLQDQPLAGYSSVLGETHVKIALLPALSTSSGLELSEYNLAYMTLGKLSPNKDNAILICHALSGNAHVAGSDPETGRPGWWDHHVGPGKTIDTDHFFVIATNVIGGCNGSLGPSSINPQSGQPYGMSFPAISIQDMVKAQIALIDRLNIDTLFAVVGGSMGGMQVMVWAVEYPQRVRNCIPIATCIAHSAMQIGFNEIGRQAIMSDPNWNNGDYYDKERPQHGLAVARMIGHVTYLSEYAMRAKFGRRQQRPARPEDYFPVFFSVESYLQYQGEAFVKRFDPNSYIYISKALDMFDLMNGRPSHDVLNKIRSQFLVISFESDWLYPPSQSRELVRALKRSNTVVSYINLDTPYGHDSFLIENPEFTHIVSNYLLQDYQYLLSGKRKKRSDSSLLA